MSNCIKDEVRKTNMYSTCAVKALILNGDEFLALSKSKLLQNTGITWNDLPGGRIDFGELSPRDALRRELLEEIGSDKASIIKPIHMTTIFKNSEAHITATIFLCKTDSKKINLSDEHLDYCWLKLSDEGTSLPLWIKESLSKITNG
ncbi:MAG: hypothetical protein S4CHLAM6_05340 [Chlamydiae bacterium]|nr:hypothetical protein [Chlamydiota bacterium]